MQLIHPEDYHLFPEFVERLEKENTLTAEVRNIRKEGSVLDVEVKLTKLDHKGNKCLLNISRDITDRKQAEEELNRQRVEQQIEAVRQPHKIN